MAEKRQTRFNSQKMDENSSNKPDFEEQCNVSSKIREVSPPLGLHNTDSYSHVSHSSTQDSLASHDVDLDKDVVLNPLYRNEPDIRSDRAIPQSHRHPDDDLSPESRERLESDSDEEEERQIMRLCPRVNCPEKIIICLDLSPDMEQIFFRTRAGDKFSALCIVKRAINIFLYGKTRLDNRHEYALAFLQDQALWMHQFTNDPQEIALILDGVTSSGSSDVFNIDTIYQMVLDRIQLPSVPDPAVIPPPYTVRVIIIYGRSHCIPRFQDLEAKKELELSPHVFVDALYVHDTPSDDNKCEAIFNSLCEVDDKGLSYVFEACRNPTKVYDCMAKLLAHPLQRPIQRDAMYQLAPNNTQSNNRLFMQ